MVAYYLKKSKSKMVSTILSYLQEPDQYEFNAQLIDIQQLDEETISLILDRSIFYPQGGGQPSDKGLIQGPDFDFHVHKCVFRDGLVHHTGELIGKQPEIGAELKLQVDQELRKKHSIIHSAGHLIDTAMKEIGQTMEPSKGYHFPDSPYVEYIGVIEAEQRPQTILDLNKALEKLVNTNSDVEAFMVERDELSKYCDFVPDYVPADKPSRVVIVGGLGCPCGGTWTTKVFACLFAGILIELVHTLKTPRNIQPNPR